MWDRFKGAGINIEIIENLKYHFLPSLRLLLECLLSKYEVLTPNSKISGARLPFVVEVGSRYWRVESPNQEGSRAIFVRELVSGEHPQD